jgi:hypothetical protein
MEMQFLIELYAKVLNSIRTDYRKILNFINIIEAIYFPAEGNNPSLADFQFHVVSGTRGL